MFSSQQLLNFGSSNFNFLEDNLLNQEDWKDDNDVFDFMSYNSSPSSSSLDSDQTSNEISPISLYNDDDIDSLLMDGLFNQPSPTTIPTSGINIDPHLQDTIKKEPPSPTPINYSDIKVPQQPVTVQPQHSPTIVPVTLSFPSNKTQNTAIKKIPISKTPSLKASRPIAPLNGKMITMPKTSTGIVSLPTSSSDVVQMKTSLPTLPVKTEQLNTAILPGEKYAIPPKIVKLENGQFYIARAVLKGTPSKQNLTTIVNSIPGQKRSSPITTASITKDYGNLKDLKRQQRMMKNRESASLSRQRKKEHLNSLESKVNEISAMNAQLKEENQKLKDRVQQLETENIQLKDKVTCSGHSRVNKENVKKTSTVVMAILLFIIFNPFPLTTRVSSKQGRFYDPKLINIPNHYRSRALLQFDNSNNIDYTYDSPFKTKYLKRSVIHDSLSARKQKDMVKLGRRMKSRENMIEMSFPTVESDCEETFNKTDVNRINKILDSLVKVYDKNESINKKKVNKPHSRRKNLGILSKFSSHNCTDDERKQSKPLMSPYDNSYRRSKIGGKPYSKTLRKRQSEKLFTYNNSSRELMKEIQRTVQRKDDTFYVVSMKDFFILPATNQSQQHRPKFSFIVPTFLHAKNGSSLQEVSMLQIDCNVLDTKLVQLNKEVLSKHFLNQLEHSSSK